jgi:signal transduction histidine kinase
LKPERDSHLFMKISIFIFLGFFIILVMFSITTYINFKLADEVNENSLWLEKSTAVVRSSNRFQRNILNMVSGLRGFLFTGDEYFIQAYDSAYTENQSLISELRPLIAREHSIQLGMLEKIDKTDSEWVANFAQPLIQARKNASLNDSSQAAFNTLYREKFNSGFETRVVNSLNRQMRNFINYEYNVRDQRKKELDKSVQLTRIISFYLTTFSIFTGLAIAAFLAVRISRKIIKMANMADRIAAGNYNTYVEETGKDELSQLATSLNNMARVLSENITLLQRKNKELDQFAHIVSHDMKAPLRGIDNVVTWIEEDHLPELSPKVKEYIGLIRSRLIRGENLIHGILSYSRIGQYEMDSEEVDLNQLLSEMRDSMPIRDGLRLQIQKNLPVLVTHRVPIMQIFTNLINNAIKYHDKSKGFIKVYFADEGDRYRFYVEDNGPGIAEIYHQKIFVIFQTLNGSDSFENTGVGLAIVKKILDDRKQEIKLTSVPGKGSTFVFTWPKNDDELWMGR